MKSTTPRSRRHRNPPTPEGEQQKPFFPKSNTLVQTKEDRPFFQPKLTIGQPGDQYEREADSVADQVVNDQNQQPVVQRQEISSIQRESLATPQEEEQVQMQTQEEEEPVQMQSQKEEEPLQMKTQEEEEPVQMQAEEEEEPIQMQTQEEEEPLQMKTQEEEEPVQMQAEEEEEPIQMQTQEEEEPLQMKTQEEEEPVQMQAEEEEEPIQMKAQAAPPTATAQVSNRIKDTSGNGQALSGKTRVEMEQAFGVDFKGVNIHTDSEAVQLSQELGAQAFTHGKDVYFNSGKFSPENSEGKHLLAHELTHVVQQNKENLVQTQINRVPQIQKVPEERMNEGPFLREIAKLLENGKITASEAQEYRHKAAGLGRRARAKIIRGFKQRPDSPLASAAQTSGARAHPQVSSAPQMKAFLKERIAKFGGLTVALYAASNVEAVGEFKGQAAQFSADHLAVGVDNTGKLIFGAKAAMQLSSSIGSVLGKVQNAIEAELQQCGSFINTLAIFTHGESFSLQAANKGTWIKDYKSWVGEIAPYISPRHPRIWLYACSTARKSSKPKRTDALPFAEAIREALQNDLELRYPNQIIKTEVGGHLTARHTTANPDIGIFSGGAQTAAPQLLQPILSEKLFQKVMGYDDFSKLSDKQKAGLEKQAGKNIAAVFKIIKADHSSKSPINAYVREIFNFGVNSVWHHLNRSNPIDFTALGYSPEASIRLNGGLSIFRGRYNLGYHSLIAMAYNELTKTLKP